MTELIVWWNFSCWKQCRFFCGTMYTVVYNICIFQKALISDNFSLFSNISLGAFRQMKAQAESDFITLYTFYPYYLKVFCEILGGCTEQKCSVGDVCCFYIVVLTFYDFFFSGRNTHKTGTRTHETGKNTTITVSVWFLAPWYPKHRITRHFNQTSSTSPKNTIRQTKKHPCEKNPSGLKYSLNRFGLKNWACGRPRYKYVQISSKFSLNPLLQCCDLQDFGPRCKDL